MCYQVLLGHNATETFEKLRQALETVFCREPRFLGGLRHFQKEENQLKTSLTAEGLHLQQLMKMLAESTNTRSDRRLTVRMIGEELNLTHTTVQILTNELGMRKIMQKWFRKIFHKSKKTSERKGALTFRKQLKTILIFWNVLLQVTSLRCLRPGNQAPEHGVDTSTSPKAKRRKNEQVKNQMHGDLPFDSQRIIHKEFVRQGQMVNQHFYPEDLERLRKRVMRVRPTIKNM